MGELMNGRGLGMSMAPGGNGLSPMHGMMSHNFAAIPTNISPSSSVLMTPKSAGTPPPAHMFQSKPFVLHHSNQTPVSSMGHYPSPWNGQNQFVFPSPTTMSYSNPSPLSATSPICSTTPMAPQWWSVISFISRSYVIQTYVLSSMYIHCCNFTLALNISNKKWTYSTNKTTGWLLTYFNKYSIFTHSLLHSFQRLQRQRTSNTHTFLMNLISWRTFFTSLSHQRNNLCTSQKCIYYYWYYLFYCFVP